MPEKGVLNPELHGYCEKIDQIRRETVAIVEGLTEEQCAWQPTSKQWSIAQCLEHLNATARNYFPIINDSINDARARGWLGAGPFRHDLLGSWFVSLNSPPPKFRIPAPRRFYPPPDRPMSEIWPSFLAFQDRLREMIRHADGVDLARAKVRSPVIGVLKMSLGTTFDFIIVHEARHLWQIRRIRESVGFPT